MGNAEGGIFYEECRKRGGRGDFGFLNFDWGSDLNRRVPERPAEKTREQEESTAHLSGVMLQVLG